MARGNLAPVDQEGTVAEVDAEAPYGRKADGTPKKRRGGTGPRQRKPAFALVRILDRDGNVVEGGTVDVALISKDPAEIMDAQDDNPGYKRIKISV
jgi:hypothetical protein